MASARFISRTNRSEAGEKRKTDFDESFGRTDVIKITDEWTDDEAICYSGRFAPGKKIIFSLNYVTFTGPEFRVSTHMRKIGIIQHLVGSICG